tara:strand:+ start:5 stop:1222 length:1218 start_codon:yes stop_codon:yes gene_type:complete
MYTGPKIKNDNLVFALDSYSDIRGFTKFGTSGTNNSHRAIRNLVDKSSTYSLENSSQLTEGAYYTLYGITYPESNYTPASRDGVTPGFDNISASKTYDASRDVNYYVFDEDTSTWLADSYFNGSRKSGHCYDTYSSTVRAAEHTKFQDDYDTIKTSFPNATHIVIGSHASENVDNDADTVTRLKEIGLPDDAVGLGRVEFVLAGKVNKPHTHHYVRENVSTAVAHMNIRLPLEGVGGGILFDGTNDYVNLGDSTNWDFGANGTIEIVIKPTGSDGNNRLWCIDNSASNLDAYLNSSGYNIYLHGGGVGTTTPITQNKSNHVVITYNSGTVQIYINGEAGTMTGTTTGYNITNNSTNNSNLYLGCYRNLGYNLQGSISVFKIYNTGISLEEVKQNFNAYKNRFDIQ